MKKILLVAKCSLGKKYSYASSFYKILQSLGYQVTLINYEKPETILGLIPNRFNDFCHQTYINQQVKIVAQEIKPHFIFFIKANIIKPTTISYLRKNTNAEIINFYPDNPFTFWNGNSNQNILLSLPLIDHFLIWSYMLIPALESAGAKQVHYFPFGYDASLFNDALPETSIYQYDVCFVGTWELEREKWLHNLIIHRPQLRLAIWGNLWAKNLPPNSPLHKYLQGPAIYGHAMRNALHSSKITLNFIRQQNMTSHNMRTFEALANKSFMLTQRTNEQTHQPFQEGKNIECFQTNEELLKKIDFYLKHDNLRKEIAQQGNSIAQSFTLQKQLQYFLEKISNGRNSEKT